MMLSGAVPGRKLTRDVKNDVTFWLEVDECGCLENLPPVGKDVAVAFLVMLTLADLPEGRSAKLLR